MATRHLIERLSERTEALVERLRPPARTLVVYVRNHLNEDEEIAAFRKQHGVTDNDMLIVVVFVPYKRRPGETASEAYRRELLETVVLERIENRLEQLEGMSAHGHTAPDRAIVRTH